MLCASGSSTQLALNLEQVNHGHGFVHQDFKIDADDYFTDEYGEIAEEVSHYNPHLPHLQDQSSDGFVDVGSSLIAEVVYIGTDSSYINTDKSKHDYGFSKMPENGAALSHYTPFSAHQDDHHDSSARYGRKRYSSNYDDHHDDYSDDYDSYELDSYHDDHYDEQPSSDIYDRVAFQSTDQGHEVVEDIITYQNNNDEIDDRKYLSNRGYHGHQDRADNYSEFKSQLLDASYGAGNNNYRSGDQVKHSRGYSLANNHGYGGIGKVRQTSRYGGHGYGNNHGSYGNSHGSYGNSLGSYGNNHGSYGNSHRSLNDGYGSSKQYTRSVKGYGRNDHDSYSSNSHAYGNRGYGYGADSHANRRHSSNNVSVGRSYGGQNKYGSSSSRDNSHAASRYGNSGYGNQAYGHNSHANRGHNNNSYGYGSSGYNNNGRSHDSGNRYGRSGYGRSSYSPSGYGYRHY